MGSVLARARNHYQRPLSLLSACLKGSILFARALDMARQMLSKRLLMRCLNYMLGVHVVVTMLHVGFKRLALHDLALGLLICCEHNLAWQLELMTM